MKELRSLWALKHPFTTLAAHTSVFPWAGHKHKMSCSSASHPISQWPYRESEVLTWPNNMLLSWGFDKHWPVNSLWTCSCGGKQPSLSIPAQACKISCLTFNATQTHTHACTHIFFPPNSVAWEPPICLVRKPEAALSSPSSKSRWSNSKSVDEPVKYRKEMSTPAACEM